MKKNELRIVFMGTPEFAVESLKALVDNGFNVVGVITAPDKPAGRGRKIQESAVKTYAISQALPVLQPEKLKDESFIADLKSLQADLQIVVAFRMLPEVVWNLPPFGTFNLHGSLLPQYRGAAPINWAIINGEKETGVTTFFIEHKIDTGNIIQQSRVPIHSTDNAEDIHDRLMVVGAKLVVDTVNKILEKKVTSLPQKDVKINTPLKEAPKIFKEDCRITWSKNSKDIYNFIRGLSPYPSAWCIFKKNNTPINVKIYQASYTLDANADAFGTLTSDNKTQIKIATMDGWIHIHDLQLAGKKRMPCAEFLRGYDMTDVSVEL